MKNNNKTNKHWIVFILACLMAAGSLGINLNTIGVFYNPVANDLGMLVGSVAFHSTLSIISLSIVSLFIPQLIKKLGFKKMVFIGSILATLSTIAMAFTSSLWVFYILGFLRGLGSGLFGVIPLTIMLNNWFDEKNGLVISISSAFAGVTGMVMSPIFNWAINSFGWRQAFILMGIILLLTSIPTALFPFELKPQDEGLLPYGMENSPTTVDTDGERTFKSTNIHFKVLSIPFATLAVLALLHSIAPSITQNFPGYSTTVGMTSAVGAALLSISMFGNIFFKVILGMLEEKFGTVINIIISLTLTIISVIAFIFIRQPFVLMFFAFLLGSAYYTTSVGLPLLTNYYYGREMANKVFPIVSFLSLMSGAFAMSGIGFIYDFTGSYIPAFWGILLLEAISLTVVIIGSRKQNVN